MKKIRQLFFTGLLTVLPLVITINIILWVLKIIDELLKNNVIVDSMGKDLAKKIYISPFGIRIIVYIIVFSVLILLTIMLGLAVRNVLGNKIASTMDRLISKIPLVKPIYTTIIQIRELMVTSKTKAYQKVVLIEYPRKGIYSLGFLTNRGNKILEEEGGNREELINVFLPTSPNPTSGMFLMLKQDEVRELDIKIEDAIKLIISGGAIMPEIYQKNGGGNDGERGKNKGSGDSKKG